MARLIRSPAIASISEASSDLCFEVDVDCLLKIPVSTVAALTAESNGSPRLNLSIPISWNKRVTEVAPHGTLMLIMSLIEVSLATSEIPQNSADWTTRLFDTLTTRDERIESDSDEVTSPMSSSTPKSLSGNTSEYFTAASSEASTSFKTPIGSAKRKSGTPKRKTFPGTDSDEKQK